MIKIEKELTQYCNNEYQKEILKEEVSEDEISSLDLAKEDQKVSQAKFCVSDPVQVHRGDDMSPVKIEETTISELACKESKTILVTSEINAGENSEES